LYAKVRKYNELSLTYENEKETFLKNLKKMDLENEFLKEKL
jgi:hypothetical protein